MQKSNAQDIQKLKNIQRYLQTMRKCMTGNDVKSAKDLQIDDIAQAVFTQCITNVYEAKNRLQDTTKNKLTALNTVRLEGARNIASHDYDNLNFNVIYTISKQLTDQKIFDEISSVLKFIENDDDNHD